MASDKGVLLRVESESCVVDEPEVEEVEEEDVEDVELPHLNRTHWGRGHPSLKLSISIPFDMWNELVRLTPGVEAHSHRVQIAVATFIESRQEH